MTLEREGQSRREGEREGEGEEEEGKTTDRSQGRKEGMIRECKKCICERERN